MCQPGLRRLAQAVRIARTWWHPTIVAPCQKGQLCPSCDCTVHVRMLAAHGGLGSPSAPRGRPKPWVGVIVAGLALSAWGGTSLHPPSARSRTVHLRFAGEQSIHVRVMVTRSRSAGIWSFDADGGIDAGSGVRLSARPSGARELPLTPRHQVSASLRCRFRFPWPVPRECSADLAVRP